MERHRSYINGMGRIIPCSASSSSNVITLTPNDAAPSIEGYIFGDCFPFWADATSTGSVTATVVPKTGTLDTLKVYLGDSITQAGSGKVVINQFYMAQYLPIADSNAGGFVLLGASTALAVNVGSFTMAAAATKVVADTNVTASSKVFLQASNPNAGARQGSACGLYVSAVSAGVSFTVGTSSGGAAGGNETYDYQIVG